MTNAEKFRNVFGLYATEVWSMSEKEFLEWLNAEIQPERKKGKWISEIKHYKSEEQEFDYYEIRCSECGVMKKIGWHGAKYCPNCGSYNGG